MSRRDSWGGLQIVPQNQAGHQLALREIVPAARGSVVRHVFGAELHRQNGNAFNHLRPRLFALHPTQDALTKKGFYKATPVSYTHLDVYKRQFIRRNASSIERKFIGESLTARFAISLMTPHFPKHGHAMPWEVGFSIIKVVMISSQPAQAD